LHPSRDAKAADGMAGVQSAGVRNDAVGMMAHAKSSTPRSTPAHFILRLACQEPFSPLGRLR
jgi:hypothetical protein